MRPAALVAAIAILALAPATAGATEVSRGELIALAERAASESVAVDELRAVTSVDGAPVNIEAVLAGADGDELQARVEAVARSAEAAPAGGIDAAEARARAADILANDELQPPQPASGDGGLDLPSVPLPVAILLAAAVVLIAALVARGLGRQAVLDREAAAGLPDQAHKTSRDLEREADDAERRGEFAAAVRLRFQAGLTRLDELGSIELRPSLTAAGAARESGLHGVGGLARDYEEVAFGGRGASAGDAEGQRTGWRAAIAEARRK